MVQRIAVRAEMSPREVLGRTFVEVEQISQGLQRIDHQVVYGRRGTGKTHAFTHLALQMDGEGDLPLYIDLRTIGSSGGLYSDSATDLHERGTRLLIDVLEALHGSLLEQAISDDRFDAILPHLDALVEAATEVRVKGPVQETFGLETQDGDQRDSETSVELSAQSLRAKLSRKAGDSKKTTSSRTFQRSGEEVPHLLFGRLREALRDVTSAISPRRVWLLLDEWSSLPLDLQPILADLIRRVFLPCPGITVKIGAIERRSRFIKRADASTYCGIELGADTTAALNLDEHLLATEAGGAARDFFSELLHRHLVSLLESRDKVPSWSSGRDLVTIMFKSSTAFEEFVRAAEGVPRDALNIAGLAAAAAGESAIGVSEIQSAARKYYLQDKETGIAGNRAAEDVWARLQREVVAGRKSRTFLLRRNREHINQGVLDLYDARLIHLLRAGLATPGRPGVAYDGYCVDYGSYVSYMHEEDLVNVWDSAGRPWSYQSGSAFLPDRFDESAIFTPSKARSARDLRRAMY